MSGFIELAIFGGVMLFVGGVIVICICKCLRR